MLQLKAGIKKEWLELCKTGRLLGILLIILGLSLFDPIMIRFLALLMEVFQDAPSMSSLEALSGVFGQQTALASYAADCVSTGMLVVFLLLMRTAGGEQKRRSVVIPLTLGFDRDAYLYAKFLVYPPLVFISVLLGVCTAYGTTLLLFTHQIGFVDILLPALALGVYFAMQVCLLLGCGCATGKAGIFVAILYLLHTILTTALGTLGWNRYNPFALYTFGSNFTSAPDLVDYSISIGLAVVVCFAAVLFSSLLFRKKKLV